MTEVAILLTKKLELTNLNNGTSSWLLVKKKKVKEQLTSEPEKTKEWARKELMNFMSISLVFSLLIQQNMKSFMKKLGTQQIMAEAVVDMEHNKLKKRSVNLSVVTVKQ